MGKARNFLVFRPFQAYIRTQIQPRGFDVSEVRKIERRLREIEARTGSLPSEFTVSRAGWSRFVAERVAKAPPAEHPSYGVVVDTSVLGVEIRQPDSLSAAIRKGEA